VESLGVALSARVVRRARISRAATASGSRAFSDQDLVRWKRSN